MAGDSVAMGIRVPRADYEVLQFLASATGHTRSEVIRMLLRRAVLDGDTLQLAPVARDSAAQAAERAQ